MWAANPFVKGISFFKDAVLGWYEEDHYLLKDFFEQHRPDQYHIQALCDFPKRDEERTSELLIGVLGCLQSSAIIQRIQQCSELLSIYNEKIGNLYQDQRITLRYYLTPLKTGNRPVNYPALQDYSWAPSKVDFQKWLQTEHENIFDKICGRFVAGLLVMPMPSQLARILCLQESAYIRNVIKQDNERGEKAISDLLEGLKSPRFSFESRCDHDPQELLKRSALLFKRAALVCYPHQFSWIDQLYKWAQENGCVEKVREIAKQLKLSFLVVDWVAQTAVGRQGGPQKRVIENPVSFTDYLIREAIEVLNTYCPLTLQLKQELTNEFKQYEAWRIDFSFFIYAMHALLRPQASELRPTFKEWTDIIFPLEDTYRPFARACQLKDNFVALKYLKQNELSKSVNSEWPTSHTVLAMQAFFGLFTLDYLNGFTIAPAKKGLLFSWIYTCRDFQLITDILSFYETICVQKRGVIQSAILSSNFSIDNPQQLLALFLWEIYLAYYLSPDCAKTILNEVLKLPEEQQNRALLCLDRIMSLYFNENECLKGVFRLLTNLGWRVQENRRLNSQLSHLDNSFEKGRHILKESGLKAEESMYDCLHAFLSLHEFYQYVRCEQLRDPLFARIQATSQKEREASVQELAIYSTQPVKQNEGDLEFQLQVIHQVEKVLHAPIPLTAVWTFLFYCPFTPLLDEQEAEFLEKLGSLSGLRQTIYVRSQFSLFVLPSSVRQIHDVVNMLTNQQDGSDLPGNLRLKTHQAFLGHKIKETLLFSLSFYEKICEQAFQLFTKHTVNPHLQNLLFLPLGTHFNCENIYLGKWKTPVYMSQWGVEKREGEIFPYFEIVICCDSGSDSCYRRFALPVPLQKLDEDAWDLLGACLESLEKDETTNEHYEGRIGCLTSSKQDYDFYSQTYKSEQPLGKKGETYNLAYQGWKKSMLYKSQLSLNNFEKLDRVLFNFVRSIKIESRKMMLSFSLSDRKFYDQTLSLLQLAAQGTIYYGTNGYSLIHPSYQSVDALFQVRHDELQTEFSHLTQELSTCQSARKWEDFGTVSLYNQRNQKYNWGVSVEFNPWPIEEEGETVYLNQMTFQLHCPPFPIVYACKFKAFLTHPDCERFLRWQLAMLKSMYYRFLLTQTQKYPEDVVSHQNSLKVSPAVEAS